jgi:hypothetical protein
MKNIVILLLHSKLCVEKEKNNEYAYVENMQIRKKRNASKSCTYTLLKIFVRLRYNRNTQRKFLSYKNNSEYPVPSESFKIVNYQFLCRL